MTTETLARSDSTVLKEVHPLLAELRLVHSLNERIDLARLDVGRFQDPKKRALLGQFLTPSSVAGLMASMFCNRKGVIRLLDAGAGIGSLSAAFVAEMCTRQHKPRAIQVTAFEVDLGLIDRLHETLEQCAKSCIDSGIRFAFDVRATDFIVEGVAMLSKDLFHSPQVQSFDCAILNPPYRKIRNDSAERQLLRSVDIETSNLYSGFLAIALELLDPDGEMVAITPRSFCNGPYFRSFRRRLLNIASLRRIHVFQSRNSTFSDDRVLQENIIFHAAKSKTNGSMNITSSQGPEDLGMTSLRVMSDELVHPQDREAFIHLVTDGMERNIANLMEEMAASLDQLGLEVSTGRVVDFRAKAHLRKKSSRNTAPLIYPLHFHSGFIRWPKTTGRKLDAIVASRATEDLLVDSTTYVLVKRFSAKEEPRRVVPAVYDPTQIKADKVGFENHLNYFHKNGRGLDPRLARGLTLYLGSTFVDRYFRQFSGHTQVNASDLRTLRYPSTKVLRKLGFRVNGHFPEQSEIDAILQEVLEEIVEDKLAFISVAAAKKVEEARTVLRSLGLPRKQQNERSCLTLLAILDLNPTTAWREASAPLLGISELMRFMADHYEKNYAPNTRETVRKDTVHQFVQAGLLLKNPDNLRRPTNSPKTVYQVAPILLGLVRTFGSQQWRQKLERYLESVPSLRDQYARERRMERVPLLLPTGKTVNLSPGGQSRLVKKVLNDFCAFFTPGGEVVYIGDTAEKWAYLNEKLLQELGVEIGEHGKIPDVVVYLRDKGWLVLIEAVESQGPMDPKRQLELRDLFLGAKAGLVFVTAFQNRKTMAKHLGALAWETEVWIAEAPSHLIHFDGERFLGPYENS